MIGQHQITAVNGDHSPIPEQQLHTAGVHVEMAGSFTVLHVCVLSALRHLYSCDLCDTVFFLIRFRTHSRQGRAGSLSGQRPSICYRRPLRCLKAPLGLSLLRNRSILVSEENKKSEPFSYREKVRIFMVWCDGRDSNPRPTDS